MVLAVLLACFLLIQISKPSIGATAEVHELQSGLHFVARVDTGASVCSIHAEELEIESEAENPRENVGRRVRVLFANKQGERKWVESKIESFSHIRTIDATRPRYQVKLKLSCNGREEEVLVSLVDRSHMKYRMLLGRNFLRDRFMVDVSKQNPEFP